MLIPAMIFAGMTLIIGGLLGYLLGAARARMSGEERLGELEAARAALEASVSELRRQLEAQPANPQDAPSPSGGSQPRG
jgi:hypothetical protein